MERSEPSLVPEWLKTSGTATGNGITTYPHSPSSSHHSDDNAVPKLARNKSSRNHNDHELGRNSSSYFRRSSNSNGSANLRSYSSFGGRNPRSRDWDRDRDRDVYERHDGEKPFVGNHKQRDFLDPPFPGNLERDGLRRSQSMISAKRGEPWSKRSIADSNTAMRIKSSEGNGLVDKGNLVGSMHKAAFEREFPSLGADEKSSAAEIGRIPSPVLSTAIHGLPLSSSSMLGADKWTSALAEVPAMAGGTNIGVSAGQQVMTSSSSPMTLSASTGSKLAEAVGQGPPRAQTAPKTSTEIQRLEELAIRQSRQLIPVTPSLPKPLVLNSSDKGKGKAGQQQQHPTPLTTAFRGVPVKSDASKTSNAGKLLLLKPVRERNGGFSTSKDNSSPTIGAKETTSALAVATSVAGSATSKGSANTVVSPSAERKHALPVLEKRPTSQSQSRNDFFNLVRRKSLPNSSAVPDAGSAVVTTDGPSEQESARGPVTRDGTDAPLADVSNVCQPMENKVNQTSNSEAFYRDGNLQNGKNHSTSLPLFSEEEEAAFLHKLGWQENADEGALTEEEINAFFKDLSKYMDAKPSVKILQGVEPKFPMLLSSQVRAVSSGLSSSDSNAES